LLNFESQTAKKLRLVVSKARLEGFRLFILDYCTVLLPYTYKALLAEMCRIGDFKGVGHFKAKF